MKLASRVRRLAALAPVLCAAACRSPDPSPEAIAAMQVPVLEPVASLHKGPRVMPGAGPARFAARALKGFDQERARTLLAFVDGFYRAPANDGYEAVLARLESELRLVGWGEHPRLQLEWLSEPEVAAWTPLAARLALRTGAGEEVLHAFNAPGDADRVMLPVGAPAGAAAGGIAFSLDELDPGEVLVSESGPRGLGRAQERGAVAVVCSTLQPYNVDPTGGGAERDAIAFLSVPARTRLPVLIISRRSYERIRAAHAADPAAQLDVQASVRIDQRPLRTLVAIVRGRDRAGEAVAIASHVQEPGANDNASGVAGMLEAARWLGEEVRAGRIQPSRSLVFLWGDEMGQSRAWLAQTALTPVAGLAADMIAADRARTGALPLLERMPDPGAVRPLPPDEHTPWGAASVRAEELTPNGLALIARCALIDVGHAAGGWESSEHPYEGGSDHSVFLDRGLPTALFWHFTDFTYHTSLDRLDRVDVAEMARMSAALVSTALALADPQPADLERYLKSLDLEQALRVAAAEEAGDLALAELWRTWCFGARQWLRNECLQIPLADRIPPR